MTHSRCENMAAEEAYENLYQQQVCIYTSFTYLWSEYDWWYNFSEQLLHCRNTY